MSLKWFLRHLDGFEMVSIIFGKVLDGFKGIWMVLR